MPDKQHQHLAKSIAALEEVAALAKSHVSGYTRKNGTFVGEHDDKRSASGIGKVTKMYTHHFDEEKDSDTEKEHVGSALDAHEVQFANRRFLKTGKKRKSPGDGADQHEFDSMSGSHPNIWVDAKGNCHTE
jgi:hypothetical protein